MRRATRHRRAGFSLIEVSLSTLFVGVMLLAAMRTVGSVLVHRTRTAVETRAQLAGKQLLAEILSHNYTEPTENAAFGRESSESNARSAFDDVDDFHLWNESPPGDRTGAALAGLTGWRRRVIVEYVDPASPATTTGSDQGLKRVTVEVYEGTRLRATVQALKASGWPRK